MAGVIYTVVVQRLDKGQGIALKDRSRGILPEAQMKAEGLLANYVRQGFWVVKYDEPYSWGAFRQGVVGQEDVDLNIWLESDVWEPVN